MAAAVAVLAPRVFAVCEVCEVEDGRFSIAAWGMQFHGEVQWASPGGHAHGISDNVDGVMRLLGRGCEAHLVWT